VFIERIQSRDFSLLDFSTKQIRQLTRFGTKGALRTFDITRDGKQWNIVFDRTRQNSNIVLIELLNGRD
jgi:hypothetical protein